MSVQWPRALIKTRTHVRTGVHVCEEEEGTWGNILLSPVVHDYRRVGYVKPVHHGPRATATIFFLIFFTPIFDLITFSLGTRRLFPVTD